LGETRVDLVHLLEDLRDGYPGPLEETILTEVVANALDSGARSLHFITDPATSTLLALDDGGGMSRAELTRYHDLAASAKRRGRGIGFAGVGIKLGLLVADEVVTETLRGKSHIATSWALANRRRAPWSWVAPPGDLDCAGTAVAFRLSNSLSPLLDRGFIAAAVLRHFQPLFEPEFLEILEPCYPDGLAISVNQAVVVGPIREAPRVPITVRRGRQRRPSALGYIARHAAPLPEQDRGIAISTLGKVIRRGWDWLGLTPAGAEYIEGLIEVPALAEALTLTKTDFLRSGSRGALFLSYRKAIQEAVSEQLAAWGDAPQPPARSRRTGPLERDLQRVLGDLAAEFPLLSTLANPRRGGQRRLPLAMPDGDDSNDSAELTGEAEGPPSDHTDEQSPDWEGQPEDSCAIPGTPTATEPDPVSIVHGSGAKRRRLPARLSLRIRFESRPDDQSLGRLLESTVWVNDAHPAYHRAVASRSDGYHMALAVAAALAPLTVEPDRTQEFLNTFLARWGLAGGHDRNGRPVRPGR
jgi:hypothetical protein